MKTKNKRYYLYWLPLDIMIFLSFLLDYFLNIPLPIVYLLICFGGFISQILVNRFYFKDKENEM